MNFYQLLSKVKAGGYNNIIQMLYYYKDRKPNEYSISGDTNYASVASSANPYPMLIGLVSPDNTADFVPYRPIMNVVSPRLSALHTGSGGGKTEVVKMEYEFARYTDIVNEISAKVYACTESRPSQATIKLLLAQIMIENGAIRKFNPNGGIQVPNYNMASIHAGKPGSFHETLTCGIHGDISTRGVANARQIKKWFDSGECPNLFNDALPVKLKGAAKDALKEKEKKLIDKYNSETDAKKKKKIGEELDQVKSDIEYRDQMNTFGSSSSNNQSVDGTGSISKQPKPVGKAFLSIDTQGAKAYPTYFKSFDSLGDGMAYYINLLCNVYPDAMKATSSDEFVEGLVNGKKTKDGRARSYMDAGAKNHYKQSIDIRLEEINKNIDQLGISDGNTTMESATLITSGENATKLTGDGDRAWLDSKIATIDMDRVLVEANNNLWINSQINIIDNTPFLRLLVNPDRISIARVSNVNPNIKTRYGNIIATWFDQPIKIQANGQTATQYIITEDLSGGITTRYRVHTISYANLMSLIRIYRSNGIIYSKSDPPIPVAIGNAVIIYDNVAYFGKFDQLSIDDDAENTANMKYSFSFTVNYTLQSQ